MRNKKGISEVVTNVLILLLVVVAVGILWAFLQPLFKGAGTKTELSQACLNLQLEPIKCTGASDSVVVTIKRGSDSVAVNEVKLIFEKDDGSTNANNTCDGVPGALETKVCGGVNLGFAPVKVGVAAGIADSTGKINYCTETPRIACAVTAASAPPPSCNNDGTCDEGETVANCPADCQTPAE